MGKDLQAASQYGGEGEKGLRDLAANLHNVTVHQEEQNFYIKIQLKHDLKSINEKKKKTHVSLFLPPPFSPPTALS